MGRGERGGPGIGGEKAREGEWGEGKGEEKVWRGRGDREGAGGGGKEEEREIGEGGRGGSWEWGGPVSEGA